MVSLKIEVKKKNITWVVLLVVMLAVGVGYAYNSGADPSVMGHSAGEIEGLGSLATKDSVSWSEISSIPAGFADGVDNGGSGLSKTKAIYSCIDVTPVHSTVITYDTFTACGQDSLSFSPMTCNYCIQGPYKNWCHAHNIGTKNCPIIGYLVN